MTSQRQTVLILAAGQALSQTVVVLMITLSALVGTTLAPVASLATVPAANFILGTALTMIPASLFMQRYGRRAGFVLGAALGFAGAVTCAVSVHYGSFIGFATGSLLVGACQGFAQYYRFAAADVASPDFRSRAISWVLVGGVVAAVAGPEIARGAAHWGAVAYVAPFLIAAGLMIAAMVVMAFVDIPHVRRAASDSTGRPLLTILRQPAFFVACGGAAAAFGVMTLAMTATPIAMTAHHHAVEDAARVIQLHVLGMFVPSFFTGALIQRFGVTRIMLAGVILLATHVGIAEAGITLPHFLSALTFLGIGWNFLYIGGTTLLVDAYRPEEKAKVQAANDLIVFAFSTTASFSSGVLLAAMGWSGVNYVAVPVLAAATALIGWYAMRRSPVATRPA